MDVVNSKKIINATKWSTISEILAKLIAPLTNMLLARLLSPEAFGVVASITMVVNFADLLSDSGFQKYLIQHEFENEKQKKYETNVAFWTNISISLIGWLLIVAFNEPLSELVGSPGLGNALCVAAASLPLTSFSSIQMALMRRDLEYNKLFKVRLLSVLLPFFVTIPLAFLGFGFWALIIGTLTGNLVNVIVLYILTKWRPSFQYSFNALKGMLSFSAWTIFESISIWLTNWADIFIISQFLDSYHLGIYKTAPSTVGGIISLVTSATTNILFASLSRLQNDENKFTEMFIKFQRYVGILVIPMGIGIFVYKNLVTNILLGSNWNDAVDLIGLWGLTSAFMVVYGNYPSEIYRSKGKPMFTVIAQWAHLIVLIPVCWLSVQNGFESLVLNRCLVRFELIIVHFFILKVFFGFSPSILIKNTIAPIVCATIMGVIGHFFISINGSIVWQFISILICMLVYLGLLCLTSMRKDVKLFFEVISSKIIKR